MCYVTQWWDPFGLDLPCHNRVAATWFLTGNWPLPTASKATSLCLLVPGHAEPKWPSDGLILSYWGHCRLPCRNSPPRSQGRMRSSECAIRCNSTCGHAQFHHSDPGPGTVAMGESTIRATSVTCWISVHRPCANSAWSVRRLSGHIQHYLWLSKSLTPFSSIELVNETYKII